MTKFKKVFYDNFETTFLISLFLMLFIAIYYINTILTLNCNLDDNLYKVEIKVFDYYQKDLYVKINDNLYVNKNKCNIEK